MNQVKQVHWPCEPNKPGALAKWTSQVNQKKELSEPGEQSEPAKRTKNTK